MATTSDTPRLADMPDFLNIEEAAKVLRICGNSVRESIRRGNIPSVRVGVGRGRLLVPRLALERLIASALPPDGGADR
jgi:excisionase family DNA binding protein